MGSGMVTVSIVALSLRLAAPADAQVTEHGNHNLTSFPPHQSGKSALVGSHVSQ